jgi:hypothetical protein
VKVIDIQTFATLCSAMGSCDCNRGYIRERVFPFLVAAYRHGLSIISRNTLGHPWHPVKRVSKVEVVVVFGCKKSHSATVDDFKDSHATGTTLTRTVQH